jgi:hypothetical protein
MFCKFILTDRWGLTPIAGKLVRKKIDLSGFSKKDG